MFNISNIKTNKNIGFFRFKKFGDDFLITNDGGDFSFLTSNEFTDFISGNLNSGNKYDELIIKNFIISDVYNSSLIEKYKQNNDYLLSGPSNHVINISSKINFTNDSLISFDSLDIDMSIETAKKIVDTIFFSSSKSLIIDFRGGEPLKNWDILTYIVEYSFQKSIYLSKDVKFRIFTDLILIDDDKMNYLLSNNFTIFLDFYGDFNIQSRKFLNYSKSNYDYVLTYISKINEESLKQGKDNVLIPILNLDLDILHNYKEIINSYIDLGLNNIYINNFNVYTKDEFIIDKSIIGDYYIEILEYINGLNSIGKRIYDLSLNKYKYKIFSKNEIDYFLGINSDGLYINQIYYDNDGKIFIYYEGKYFFLNGDDNFLVGDLGEMPELTYKNFINSDTIKLVFQSSITDGLPGYNDSVYKPYITLNPIYSYLLTGNIIPIYSKDIKKSFDYKVLDYLFLDIKEKGGELSF